MSLSMSRIQGYDINASPEGESYPMPNAENYLRTAEKLKQSVKVQIFAMFFLFKFMF